jgi:hypothetical protein
METGQYPKTRLNFQRRRTTAMLRRHGFRSIAACEHPGAIAKHDQPPVVLHDHRVVEMPARCRGYRSDQALFPGRRRRHLP